MLPRHLEIIYEINRRFLHDVALAHPGDHALIRRLSLIDETGDKYVRMAHLASVASHARTIPAGADARQSFLVLRCQSSFQKAPK